MLFVMVFVRRSMKGLLTYLQWCNQDFFSRPRQRLCISRPRPFCDVY